MRWPVSEGGGSVKNRGAALESALPRLADPAAFPGWLHGIVRRQELRVLRKRTPRTAQGRRTIAGHAHTPRAARSWWAWIEHRPGRVVGKQMIRRDHVRAESFVQRLDPPARAAPTHAASVERSRSTPRRAKICDCRNSGV